VKFVNLFLYSLIKFGIWSLLVKNSVEFFNLKTPNPKAVGPHPICISQFGSHLVILFCVSGVSKPRNPILPGPHTSFAIRQLLGCFVLVSSVYKRRNPKLGSASVFHIWYQSLLISSCKRLIDCKLFLLVPNFILLFSCVKVYLNFFQNFI
jgi:hypothetical protein